MPVLPCQPADKRPYTDNGFRDATTDPEVVKHWWKRWPKALVGVPTGRISRLVVVDIDPDGADWYREHMLDLRCRRVHRTRRGHHLLYRMPEVEVRNSASRIARGVDVRGEGGYVVWWPAHGLEAVGDFEDLTDLPEWLLKLANGVSSDSGTSSHSGEAKIREGGRNDRLSREAYKLRKQGCSVEQIIEILRALNAQLCDPPLSDREVCVIGEGKASIPPDDGAECIFEGERSENPRGSTDSRGPTTDWPDPLDLADLARTEPDAPRMLIDDWLPCGYVTLMAGHGGVGKSGIALHLAACIALGVPFFGLAVRQCRVLYLSCEDRTRVLHWRLHRICRHLGVTLDALAGQLHIIDLVGHDAVLWERDPRTGQTLTEAYGQLRKRVREHCIELLMVDGISDTYGGNENARTDVNRYVNALVGLVPEDTGAILLVGHINRPTASGMPTSEGYSGSTGWHNSVRARWFLHPETEHLEDGDRPERTGDLILELQKSNLGRIDQSMRFRWDDSAHLFIGQEIVGATKADRDHRDRTERRGIVNALRGCATHGIDVPAATTGPRTAYHVLSARKEFPKSLIGKPNVCRFRRHIEKLRQTGEVGEAPYRRINRHWGEKLVLCTPEKTNSCANAPNDDESIRRTNGARRPCANAPNGAGGIRGERAHIPVPDKAEPTSWRWLLTFPDGSMRQVNCPTRRAKQRMVTTRRRRRRRLA